MAHPSIGRGFDPRPQRVVEDTRCFSRRVTPPLPGYEGSFFQRLRPVRSVDPVTGARCPYVYQDLWGKARIPAKAIYGTWTTCRSALAGGGAGELAAEPRPLRGGFRACRGLVTDVELVRERSIALSEGR